MHSPTPSTAAHWNRTLRHFRFRFAHGGHANDTDTLGASLVMAPGASGLLDLFDRIRVSLKRIPDTMPRRVPGVAYNSLDWNKYADPIPAYPAYAAPSFVKLFDAPAHLGVHADRVDILLSGANGDIWCIDDRDFEHALRLEAELPAAGVAFVAEPALEQVERLYGMLARHGLKPAWTQDAKPRASTGEGDARYRQIRAELGADFGADELWRAAHREVDAILASAAWNQGATSPVARRFPGIDPGVIDAICADVRRRKP